MKRDTENMYATMNPWRLFFIVAIPGMISMFAMSIYGIIEGAFIGQKLGESAFAAVNITMPVVMVNFAISDLIGVGASVPISIALGKKNQKVANNVFSCSIILIFVTSLILGAIIFFTAEPLCRLLGANEELIPMAMRYLRTFALCSPLSTLFFAMDNFLRISGYVKASMLIYIGSTMATAGLLALFLIGFEMDVSGSALATSISMSVSSLLAMIPFIRGKALLKFAKPQFHLKMIREIVACGSPVFFSNVSGRITAILINISLMSLGVKLLGEGGGTTAVASYAVLMYAGEMCQPLLYGMSDSLAPALGYNWGAEKYDRVKRIAGCGYIGALIIGLLATVFLYTFSDGLAAVFSKAEDVKLLALSSRAIKLFCTAYLFRWLAVATQSFLSAIEKPVQATILAIAVAFVFPGIVLALFWRFGLDGIWLNTAGAAILSAVLSVVLIVGIVREIEVKKRANGEM